MFLFPVKNHKITRGYEPASIPEDKGIFHAAIDIIPTTPDYNIYAPMDGYVAAKGKNPVWGEYFVLHNEKSDREFGFAHCSIIHAKLGEHVERGQRLGVVGNTGNSVGVHLHFATNKPGVSSIVVANRMVQSENRCEDPLPLLEEHPPEVIQEEPTMTTSEIHEQFKQPVSSSGDSSNPAHYNPHVPQPEPKPAQPGKGVIDRTMVGSAKYAMPVVAINAVIHFLIPGAHITPEQQAAILAITMPVWTVVVAVVEKYFRIDINGNKIIGQ